MDTEALARELHDVAFAWNNSKQPWDGLTEEQREWFMERAVRLLNRLGWTVIPPEEEDEG
jgi:hypothetical protein